MTPAALSLLAAERDAIVASLRARADELAAMAPIDFLEKHGLFDNSAETWELAARLAAKGWRSVTWDAGKPGWEVYGADWSGYRSWDEVAQMLNAPTVRSVRDGR